MCARLVKPQKLKTQRTWNKETKRFDKKKPTKAEVEEYNRAAADYNQKVLDRRNRKSDSRDAFIKGWNEGRTERSKARAGARKTLYAAHVANQLGDNYENGQKYGQTVVYNNNNNNNYNGTSPKPVPGPTEPSEVRTPEPQKQNEIKEDSLVESPPESGLSTNPPTADDNQGSEPKKKAGKNSWGGLFG